MTHRKALLGLLVCAAAMRGQGPAIDRASILARVDQFAPHYGALSRQIWEHPETGYQEVKSAAIWREELRKAGFRIEDNIAGIPTAFYATWGEGKPVIAILGEYDALPGLSQADVPERRPIVEGGPGHGCGHNLFGAASALAAVAVKDYLTAKKLPGTIRFYGTPAEEGGAGKVFMLRAGAFRDVDVSLAWHPASFNAADNQPWLANVSARVRFTGRAAHAAASPDAGRSALDAIEVMTHAVNLLREHVPQETRIHYVITQGGSAANIVPETAELSIIVRHPDQKTLESIWERVLNTAQAGALATGTTMKVEIASGYANYVPNDTLVTVIDRSLRAAGGVQYTPEERSFAEKIRSTLDLTNAPPLGSEADIQKPFTGLLSASTDVGDVSWAMPTGHFLAATFPPGTPFHTWQSTACAGASVGRKGMVVAAKTLAQSAAELFTDPSLVRQARADWEKRLQGRTYRSLIPADKKPAPR
jgi:aminobenzoyl-glutamate utilization protein B